MMIDLRLTEGETRVLLMELERLNRGDEIIPRYPDIWIPLDEEGRYERVSIRNLIETLRLQLSI